MNFHVFESLTIHNGCFDFKRLLSPLRINIPYVGQYLICCSEPSNSMDKCAVSALHDGTVVGHLMHGSSGRFAKVIFYFLQANPSNTCTAVITGKPVNLGKGKGMQVPCTLKFDGSRQILHTLQNSLP